MLNILQKENLNKIFFEEKAIDLQNIQREDIQMKAE